MSERRPLPALTAWTLGVSAVTGSMIARGAESSAEPEAARPNANTAPVHANDTPLGPLELALFVDSYAAWQTNDPGTLATTSGHRAFGGQGATLRSENGLALAWLGLDVSYDAGSFGALASLRFGQAASIFHYHATPESDATFGIDHLTQAYALWRPVPRLELDFGMFMSPFGAESLESWKNPNYTISALYVAGQPSRHTGLKAHWQLDDAFDVMGLVVNGGNNLSETQQNSGLSQRPTLGAALGYAPIDVLALSLGGLFALDGDHNDDGGVDAFVDFVSTLELGPWTGIVNADYILTRNGGSDGNDRHFLGCSLTAGYRFTDSLGVAARGEYLTDDADYGDGDKWRLATGTLTLDIEPVPDVPNLILRWDNRWEKSNQRVFGNDSRGTPDTNDDSYRRTWFASIVGVVVTTAP